jgi:hypothetical protein
MPNNPIVIRAHIKANLATSEARLRIVLPEVEAARANGFATLGRIVGMAIPSLREVRRPMAAGDEAIFVERVTIPVSGYFRAIVSAFAPNSDAFDVTGRPIQNTTHEEVWFFLDPAGGKATRVFDPVLVPDSIVPRPGLTRLKPRLQLKRSTTTPESSALRSSRSMVLGAPGVRTVTYFNSDLGVYQPLAFLAVSWQEWDPFEGRPAGGGFLYTDENGQYTEPCPSDNGGAYNNSVTGSINTEGLGIVRWQSSSVIGGWNGDPFSCTEQSEPYVVSNGAQAQVFVNLQRIIPASRTAFGHALSADVSISPGAPNNFYSGDTKQITLRTDAIWSDWGRFTLSHEYGHEVHDQSLGGIVAQAGDCVVHYLDQPSNLGCAWKEGVADFHAAISEGTSNIYTAPFYNNGYFAPGPYTDGSLVEGAVAAFMVDVLGGIAMTTQEMAGTVRTCRLNNPLVSPKLSGVDDLVYCLERVVDSNVRANFFAGRTHPALSITTLGPLSSGWSQAAVRQLWQHDLYKM